jgi:hypothetical protein
MFTIMVSRSTFGRITLSGYFGTFADTDSACDAAVAIESAPSFVPTTILDVIPVPDGVTPMPVHEDFLDN